jgi:hypothetical protein
MRTSFMVGKPEGNISLGRPIRRWEDNIRLDLEETGGVLWTGFIWLMIGANGRLFRTRQ